MRHVELPFASRSQQHHSRTDLLLSFQLSLISLARAANGRARPRPIAMRGATKNGKNGSRPRLLLRRRTRECFPSRGRRWATRVPVRRDRDLRRRGRRIEGNRSSFIDVLAGALAIARSAPHAIVSVRITPPRPDG